MKKFIKTVSLTLCMTFMLVMGSMQFSMASHSTDHHHHSAQTHTTGVCAWMCAAAQTISTDVQVFSPSYSLLERIPSSPPNSVHVPSQFSTPSRAPPSEILPSA